MCRADPEPQTQVEGFTILREPTKPASQWILQTVDIISRVVFAFLWLHLVIETLGETAAALFFKTSNAATPVDPCIATAARWLFTVHDRNTDGILDIDELHGLAHSTGDTATSHDISAVVQRYEPIHERIPARKGLSPEGLIRAYIVMGEAVLRTDASTPMPMAFIPVTTTPFVSAVAVCPHRNWVQLLGGRRQCLQGLDRGFQQCREWTKRPRVYAGTGAAAWRPEPRPKKQQRGKLDKAK